MTATVTQSRKVWNQLVEAVTHTVVGDRRTSAGSNVGRVPEAFEVFHVEIEGAEEVARALETIKGSIDNGLYIGVYSLPQSNDTNTLQHLQQSTQKYNTNHNLLELWCLERNVLDSRTPSRQSANNTKAEQVALRLFMRSLYSWCRLLPLGSSRSARKKKVGFFVVPTEAFDIKTGMLQAGKAATAMGDSFDGHARFEGLQEQRKWRPIVVGSQNSAFSFSLSVSHTAGVPEIEDAQPDSTTNVSIIGDYVNVGDAGSSLQPPFRQKPSSATRPSSAAIPIQPVQRGGVRFNHQHPGRATVGTATSSTPPPFALTPTPSSLQSVSSFNKVFGKGDTFGGRSVSPPDASQHWVPKFEPATTGLWHPRGGGEDMAITQSMLQSTAQSEMAPFMAFLEEDNLDGIVSDHESEGPTPGGVSLSGTQSRGAHGDDDVARFRERFESVSLEKGFAAHSVSASSYGESSNTAPAPPQRTIRDLVHQMEALRSDFTQAQAV